MSNRSILVRGCENTDTTWFLYLNHDNYVAEFFPPETIDKFEGRFWRQLFDSIFFCAKPFFLFWVDASLRKAAVFLSRHSHCGMAFVETDALYDDTRRSQAFGDDAPDASMLKATSKVGAARLRRFVVVLSRASCIRKHFFSLSARLFSTENMQTVTRSRSSPPPGTKANKNWLQWNNERNSWIRPKMDNPFLIRHGKTFYLRTRTTKWMFDERKQMALAKPSEKGDWRLFQNQIIKRNQRFTCFFCLPEYVSSEFPWNEWRYKTDLLCYASFFG